MSTVKDTLAALSNDFDIMVLGDLQVGKTSLVLRYTHNSFIPDVESSIEELYTKVLRKGTAYSEISILDTSNVQDTHSPTRRLQLVNTGSILLVYSIVDRMSFEALDDWCERISSIRGELPPIAVVGLKSDLDGERVISYEEGKALATQLGAIHFTEACAKTGHGVSDAFKPLVERAVAVKYMKTKQNDMSSMRSLKEVLSDPSLDNTFGSPKSTLNFPNDKIYSDSMNTLTDEKLSPPSRPFDNQESINTRHNENSIKVGDALIPSDQHDTQGNSGLDIAYEKSSGDEQSLPNRSSGSQRSQTRGRTTEDINTSKEKSGCCIIM